MRGSDGVVVQASANAGAARGLPDGVLGRRLRDLGGDLAARLAPRLIEPLAGAPAALRLRAGDPATAYDATVHRPRARRLDDGAVPAFQAILGSVVENAQLAAPEIAEGVELARMPEMLESVRASVARTAEVLEALARHPAEDGIGGDA